MVLVQNDALGEPYQAAPRSHPRVRGNPVITGLVPVIHVLLFCGQDVDGRVKPGHDELEVGPDRKQGKRSTPHAFFFTSLMLEKMMPSARSLV